MTSWNGGLIFIESVGDTWHSPTIEETVVRQAYARLLKSNRPEDDPQAFATLRRAYEVALAICRNNQESIAFQAEIYSPEQSEAHRASHTTNKVAEISPSDAQLPFTTKGYLAEFKSLAGDYASYPMQERWLKLIDQAQDLNYWERETLGHMLAIALAAYVLLPSFVWEKMEELFQWEQNRGRLDSGYHDAELDWLKEMGHTARLLRTEEILPCPGGPEYLDALRQFYINRDAIHRPEVSDRLNSFVWERDKLPAALLLHLALFREIGSWKTLSEPQKHFSGNGGLHVALLRGEALRRLGDYQGALNMYDNILKEHPDHQDALRWSAVCAEQMGHATEAARRYEQVMDCSPYDLYAQCAALRLNSTPAVFHRTWRSLFLHRGSLFAKYLLYALFAVWFILSVIAYAPQIFSSYF